MMMTKEEATEIILRGPIHETCPNCRGTGLRVRDFLWHEKTIGRLMTTELSCTLCKGNGQRMHSDYLIACVILHLPFPDGGFSLAVSHDP